MNIPISIFIAQDMTGADPLIVVNPGSAPAAELIQLLSHTIGRIQAATTPAAVPEAPKPAPEPAEPVTEEDTPDGATADRPADPGTASDPAVAFYAPPGDPVASIGESDAPGESSDSQPASGG